MECDECEELKRRQAAATVEYVAADQRRKAYVPKGPISCFPVAIGSVRRQDRWRAAKGDGDFHAKKGTVAYEPT
jgi:hypothetical protein